MDLSNATKQQLCLYINKIKDFPSLTPENCQYRGEGNFSIVIHLKKEGKVLKLIKNLINEEDKTVGWISGKYAQVHDHLATHLEYLREAMVPLLGRSLVDIPMLMPLTEADVRFLNKLIEPHRPARRRQKTVQEAPTLGMLLPDYCTIPPALRTSATAGPVLGVEIKPKQGFIPFLDSLPPGHELRSRVCRFCLMQSYKLEKGAITEKSSFCPIDFFSGCRERMMYAVKQLIKTPQNNFRIFKDQRLVFGEDRFHGLKELREVLGEDVENQLATLVARALSTPGLESTLLEPHHPQHCLNSTAPVCRHGCKLQQGSVLHRMWAMERLAQEDVIQHLDSFCAKLPGDSGQSTAHLYPLSGYPKPAVPKHLGRSDQGPGESSVTFHSRKIWEFLLSLSLKDSSLMLAFQPLPPGASFGPQHTVQSGGKSYVYSVGLADLDLKHICKVAKVHQDTLDMIDAYTKQQGPTRQPASPFTLP